MMKKKKNFSRLPRTPYCRLHTSSIPRTEFNVILLFSRPTTVPPPRRRPLVTRESFALSSSPSGASTRDPVRLVDGKFPNWAHHLRRTEHMGFPPVPLLSPQPPPLTSLRVRPCFYFSERDSTRTSEISTTLRFFFFFLAKYPFNNIKLSEKIVRLLRPHPKDQ